MVQLTLGTKRTALALYGVLLVLPTLVLGGLHYRQLSIDQQQMLATVPNDARDATKRLQAAIERKVREVIDREEERPFYEYRENYYAPGTEGAELATVPSPLRTGPAQGPILGWFSVRIEDQKPLAKPLVLLREPAPRVREEKRNELLYSTLEFLRLQHNSRIPFIDRFKPKPAYVEREYGLPTIAINLSPEDSIDCVRDDMPALRAFESENCSVSVDTFTLHFYRDDRGLPRIVANREVRVPKNERMKAMPQCFTALGRGETLEQGFFIDPDWLFGELPASLASTALEGSQVYLPIGSSAANDPEVESFPIRLAPALKLVTRTQVDAEYPTIHVAVNKRDLEARFRTQSIRFLGVAAMLIVSLGTGLILLLRSVNRDLESARRTENFVAAVTHELRTPVAAIKLYGEMLQDGWVSDPEKIKEYYRRIVRETGRLETLVENVLEKSNLAQRGADPEPGDLVAVIETLAPSLLSLGPEGVKDLEFQMEPDLPPVMLIPEGVRSIVTNLVENARKYAPVSRDAATPEPILVKAYRADLHVVLDVLDRGPGIPQSERTRIFEAFYRLGNEATRTARGTGLGLHLVAMQSSAMGARVAVLDRKGGGSIFRVTFEIARDPVDVT